MADRKLATIRVIGDLKPIPKADMIEVAEIDGWKVVVKKGEFKVGDPCIYFEIDSFLPRQDPYTFLEKSCLRNLDGHGPGYRLRTIKLRGQVSQGLALPVNITHDGVISVWDKDSTLRVVNIGDDVTDLLGVVKWDPPLPASLAGKVKGNFPSFIFKTDQERIQNCFGDYEERKDHDWEVTTKLDGSSCTMYMNDGKFGVCSRNLDLIESEENTFWQVANALNMKDKLLEFGKNIAIQGELMGPGIQKNPEGLKEHKFFVFDVFDIDLQRYYTSGQRTSLTNHLNLDHVPILHTMYHEEFGSAEEILAFADGPSLNEKKLREGVVFKSNLDPSFSFKAISNKWLLKNEE